MRVVCAFEDALQADATVKRALRLCPEGGELLLLGGFRPPAWESAGPAATRRIGTRAALSAALAKAAEQAWRSGVSARASVCPAEELDREARIQALALGAERIVLADRPRGFERLTGRPPQVRTLRVALPRPVGSAA